MANISELMSDAARQLGARPMAVKEDDVPNAETDGSTLWYSSNFMSSLESAAGSDGVRFAVAHELGHQVAGMDVGGHAGEFAADAYAARCLAQSGGEFTGIARLFSFLGSDTSSTHPSSSARLENARRAFTEARAEAGEVDHEKTHDRSHERDLAI